MNPVKQRRDWDDVLDFWFPEGQGLDIEAPVHQVHWFWRMQGAADDEIVARFSKLTEQAAAGGLDHWAQEPHWRWQQRVFPTGIMRRWRRRGSRWCMACRSAIVKARIICNVSTA